MTKIALLPVAYQNSKDLGERIKQDVLGCVLEDIWLCLSQYPAMTVCQELD